VSVLMTVYNCGALFW